MAWTAETSKAIAAEKEKMARQIRHRLETEMANSQARANACKERLKRTDLTPEGRRDVEAALTEHNAERGAYSYALQLALEVLR